MNVASYTQAELKRLQEALERASEEAAASGLDVPVELMAKRVFGAAEKGLRDVDTLKEVALGKEAWPPAGANGQGLVIDPATLGTRS
ncbi:hypothetical protein [Hyphomicrobium sp.]|uniref:hypothetical protein n=1 Tax=Hyphomicrobium sp. TaxID=82 RepID=UPI002BF0C459|nr:hypothetical protein [Hyphomicrobium sp.]HRN89356.1 hypothetical protein [Hyphomicrobium sp.]HRQ28362.1 hypothetical protein [Hyphomicrobium sp.]